VLQHQARLASSVLALRRTARTDVLTGLPNRAHYFDQLARSLTKLDRQDGLVAAIYLEVDYFKGINDSLGHPVGDWVLVELANRLTGILRPTDTLARRGGDEFAAVYDGLDTTEDVDAIANRMLAAVDRPWLLNGANLDISVSIGIAVTGARDVPPSDLLRAADLAMYRAKLVTGSAWVREAERPQPTPSLSA
jgi:diguanylate cyclase (GGDEF)-like protein